MERLNQGFRGFVQEIIRKAPSSCDYPLGVVLLGHTTIASFHDYLREKINDLTNTHSQVDL